MNITQLIITIAWVAACTWFLYRNHTVCKYRFALIDYDIRAYMVKPSYEAMLLNPKRFPVKKMKAFINESRP